MAKKMLLRNDRTKSKALSVISTEGRNLKKHFKISRR